MMMNYPKNNSNPAVFIGIFFLREHLMDFPAAAVVWYSFELKENGTDPHLITFNSPLVCGLLSDAWPIKTNTTSHHLLGPRVFRCAFMIKAFALKRLLRKLRPVLLLAVPRSGAGWREAPSTFPSSANSEYWSTFWKKRTWYPIIWVSLIPFYWLRNNAPLMNSGCRKISLSW